MKKTFLLDFSANISIVGLEVKCLRYVKAISRAQPAEQHIRNSQGRNSEPDDKGTFSRCD